MIRSRLGRRVGAALAALLLFLNLAAPLAGASANSSNLPPVGWAETVSAFLMSCGIYPFETDENGDYTEWSAASLAPLWNQFREDVTTVSNDIWDMVGYLVNGVIAVASGRWSVLREFASWIVNKFSVTDNQTGLQLGITDTNILPFFDSEPSAIELKSRGLIPGASVNGTGNGFYGSSLPNTVSCYASNNSFHSFVYSTVSMPPAVSFYYSFTSYDYVLVSAGSEYTFSIDGQTYYVRRGPSHYFQADTLNSAIPAVDASYNSFSDIFSAYVHLNYTPSLSGVTADTTTVSIPAELPADTQYGGLTVAGAGAAVTVEALTEIVQEAVIEGLKPIVNTVHVNLSPDIEVNPDSGEITQGEITITPADIDLVSTDYQIRQLHTVFPFSIPWDVANVLSALNAEPVRPYWEVSLTLPGILGQPDTQIPFTIGISDDSPLAGAVDNFAALARNFFLVLMCVGTLMLFRKR